MNYRKYLYAGSLTALFVSVTLALSCSGEKREITKSVPVLEAKKVDNGEVYNSYNYYYEGMKSVYSDTSIPVKVADVSENLYAHKIIADRVNLRNSSDISSKVVSVLDKDERIKLISRAGDWSRVETPGGTEGWVNNDFLASKNYDPSKNPKKVVSLGQQIVNSGRKYLNVKYVWGGTTPRGFDCSGFTSYVYSKFGIGLERVACDQARQGKKVSRDSLKPGDLVFFDTDGGHNYINHVGMYIGGGQFMHASSGYNNGHKVVISDLSDYDRCYMTARRIVN